MLSHKIKYSVFLFSTILTFACRFIENNGTDGGPCTYETKYFPAEVFEIIAIDSLYSEVYFVVKGCSDCERDTLVYSGEFTGYLPNDSIEANRIALGSRLKYKVMEIKSGSCSPHIEVLLNEKFE